MQEDRSFSVHTGVYWNISAGSFKKFDNYQIHEDASSVYLQLFVTQWTNQ